MTDKYTVRYENRNFVMNFTAEFKKIESLIVSTEKFCILECTFHTMNNVVYKPYFVNSFEWSHNSTGIVFRHFNVGLFDVGYLFLVVLTFLFVFLLLVFIR